MRLLLDTNTFLWQISAVGDGKLGVRAKELLTKAGVIYVSAISIVEMQIKTMSRKLDAPRDCVRMVEDAGDVLMDFSPEAANKLRDFPTLARHDPFDRMLLAQAAVEQLTLMTGDRILLKLGLPYVIDARK